jgi:diguanylate cyclase (GGDEF)-like protein
MKRIVKKFKGNGLFILSASTLFAIATMTSGAFVWSSTGKDNSQSGTLIATLFLWDFLVAFLSYKAIRLLSSIDGLAKGLCSKIESNIFDDRFDESMHPTSTKTLVISINKVLDKIEERDQKVEEMSNICDQREQENQLLWLEIEHNLCLAKEEAETDGITKLYNRKSIDRRFASEIEHAVNGGFPLSVLMCDLDRFKDINDTYGHEAGDEVLKIFAETLRGSIRTDDVPARYGGEEFLVLLPRTPAEIAVKVANRINKAFNKAVEANLSDKFNDLSCTVSIGVADFPGCANDREKLASAADIALYKAKEEGRNRVVYYKAIGNQLDEIA